MKKTRFITFVAAIAFSAALSGCVTGEEKEISTGVTSIETANALFAKGHYTQASRIYRRVLEEEPDYPARKQLLLALADALYKDGEFFEAPLYYERFLELYPLDPLAQRAAFYYAMSVYHDSYSPDRDQTNTRKALTALKSYVEIYPKSPLAPQAKRRQREMERKLRDSEMEVARFYHKINRNSAAIRRLQSYLETYPKSPEAAEALYLLGDSFYKEGAHTKAAQIFTILLDKYPGSDYAQQGASRANKILGKEG